MKYYLIAGEASGDLHGSNLIKSLKRFDPNADIRCWGGDKMQQAGGKVVRHIRELAFMGFAEVLRNLPAILKNIRYCKEDILSFQPDAVVLIDYPGFNMRIAKWTKKRTIKTVYYISPQVWAWKESRVKTIRRTVDKMLVIFPFEKTFYQKWKYDVEYVGHPLVPVINEFKKTHAGLKKDPHMIALLPGSRKQEIMAKLPVMLEATRMLPSYKFFVAKAPSIDDHFYHSLLSGYPDVKMKDDAYSLLMQSQAAMVTSGTATLETALFEVPEVVCYKTGSLSYAIGKRLIKLKFICIVNLIMNKEVVKELIQFDLTPENIVDELKQLLDNEERRSQIFSDYNVLTELLSHGGNASDNAAKAILEIAETG